MHSQGRGKIFAFIIFSLTLIVPLIVSYFHYPDTGLPPGFGVFPPQYVKDLPDFHLVYLILMLIPILWVSCLIIKPKCVGFSSVAATFDKHKQRVLKPLPWWFYCGGIVMLFFWGVMWTRSLDVLPLAYYAFTPLWWGFILVLDGFVYKLNNGKSPIATKPILFLMIGVISSAGWAYFEFFNYFVLSNWYYPNIESINLSQTQITLLFLLSYTTVTPAIIEWYLLLSSFDSFKQRYCHGPRWPLRDDALILCGLMLLALMVCFPLEMYWVVWVGPLAVVTGILEKCRVWHPFQGVLQRGDWSDVVLIGLASIINGFFWEMWNYGSAHPYPEIITNPHYWLYEVPYVNLSFIQLPTEMPLLGYFGYLPFGVLVWQLLLLIGYLINVPFDIKALGRESCSHSYRL
ncbi:mechanosensitive ion channel protein MscS [Vibrio vulnificus]|uniref:mechanosensitive ion channel protein MscS n=1 Tax=Vibrio vulnificus TaxID=672 RepID=UPI001CDB788A|nr:mechanosensitive ion channel protein MscS [Vibrio vulnificus]MCA3960753.1 mechanosensitive ion channel protein MscS [Vibrio vulnificus]